MIPGTVPTGPSQGRVLEDVLVTSRYLLVAQAIEAALHRRELPSRLVPWGSRLDHLGAEAVSRSVVLLLDELDSRAAIDLVCRVTERCPVRVLVLTGRAVGPAWGAVLAAGATGVSHSGTSLDELESLLWRVAAGEPVLSEEVRTELLHQWNEWLAEESDLRTKVSLLFPREVTVLGMLAQGLRVAEISEQLGVSEATVRSQVKSLRRKLDVDSQLGAVAVARRLAGDMPEGGFVVPAPRRGSD